MRVLLLGEHVFAESTGGHEVVYRSARDYPCTLAEIRRTLPEGWEPDLIVHRMPEYHVVPPDLAEAPCATVALISDWNLHYDSPLAAAAAFDHVFTERLGVETFRRAGVRNVDYFPMFGFRPHMHWRPDPMPAPEHDLSIVANLSPHVQRERARWIERIAALSARHRVAALTGLFEEAYTRAVQRSRITFNRSIRGEMNMRAYEAPACGSLLFLERDNQEVRDFLEDRRECVLYGEDDFEDLVAHYLEHEDQRARIALAGHKAIQPHTYEARLQQIIAACDQKGMVGRATRRAYPAVLASRSLQTANQPEARLLALRVLEPALTENPWSGEILNDMAVHLAAAHVPGMSAAPLAEATPEARAEALAKADALLAEARQAGGGAVSLLNRAAVALAGNDRNASAAHLQEALAWAANELAPASPALLLAPPYEPFRLAWEQAAGESPEDPKKTWRRRRVLLEGEAWRRLGRLLEEAAILDRASDAYARAAAAFPQVEALAGLARTRAALKDWKTAETAAAAAVHECPLYLQARWDRIQLLAVLEEPEGQAREALRLLQLARTMASFQGDKKPIEDALREAVLAACRRAVGGGLERHEALESLLHDALQALPADRALQRMRGLLLAILGRDAEALHWLGEPSPDDDPMQAAYRALVGQRQRVRQALAALPEPPQRMPKAPNHPLRVAHLHATFDAGGIEQYILDLVRSNGATPDVHHDVFLYQDGGRLAVEAEAAGAAVRVFPVLGDEVDPAAFQALVEALHEGGYDIAHLHFGGGDVIGHEAARRAGIPKRIETVHWTVSSIDPDLDAVICPSKLLQNLQARKQNAVHIPLGVDTGRFRPGAPQDGPPTVGRVSRLVPEKDPLTFVRAAAMVPEARFVLVGDGPMRAELEALATPNVVFTGSLRGDDLVAALQQMDVFAYTPLGESFGLVVAEAMACGLPVVTTPVDALPELVRDGFNGVHVPPRDPRALAEAVVGLLRDNRRRALMAKRSRFLVEQGFSRDRMLAAHLDLYREMARSTLRHDPPPADRQIRAFVPHLEEIRFP